MIWEIVTFVIFTEIIFVVMSRWSKKNNETDIYDFSLCKFLAMLVGLFILCGIKSLESIGIYKIIIGLKWILCLVLFFGLNYLVWKRINKKK